MKTFFLETLSAATFVFILFNSCAPPSSKSESMSMNISGNNNDSIKDTSGIATFGAGCFWCVEAIFQQLDGVTAVRSGYTGGQTKNPTYEQVCSGTTGHAEVIQIDFDPSKVSYPELLEVFWKTHDPTTMNRQGNDLGTQYRSVIYYHNPEQKALAEKYKKELDVSGAWDKPLVTEITAISEFYKAEEYHQNYYNNNGDQPYCAFLIQPKLEKFRKVFKEKLKQ